MSNYSKNEAIKELQKKLEIEKAKFDNYQLDIKRILNKICAKFGVRETLLALGEFKDVEIIDELSSKQEEDELPVTICPLKDGKDEISLCKSCYSMTKTIKGKCGKCKKEKEDGN
jgi:hypothetical protein